ncbi:MAG: bifunctional folylpolyglutamate synthase/dihydrofolate synthase [Desulfobacter sp.]|nr:bifunctional folylpolyglutamate synthase/dihydrofolate synthase [Desulfobacter sp.]WDP85600.1 MAG: bifunctional folylpolyglutamate synthase/dihydrofolate synthase [Desulfobacter sp.]
MAKTPYDQCLDKIYKLGRFGIKLELDTIQNILRFLNHPQKNFATVHVAGTNGKGSTASYIAAILTQAGFKTGLYTSPHLVRFNERISINGNQISDEEVVLAYEAVNAVDIGKRKATFFEFATAMAFYHFSKEQVDWAVIETGMGGRFDATNIVRPEVSVITNLSIEHTDYLGNTIQDLAREKGGIIKAKTPVVTAVTQPSGLRVIQKTADKNKAPLFQFKKDFSLRKTPREKSFTFQGIHQAFRQIIKPLPGDHQKENLSLALAACELIFKQNAKNDNRYDLSVDLVRQGLSNTRWPGRLEKISDKPLVILDGAHNLKAAQVLGKYLEKTLGSKTLTLVVGILDDKPFEKMLAHLLPLAHQVIITKAKIDRSLDPQVLASTVKKSFTDKVMIIEDVAEAVSHAISTCSDDDTVCIAGSLYVAGEAKRKFELDFIS